MNDTHQEANEMLENFDDDWTVEVLDRDVWHVAAKYNNLDEALEHFRAATYNPSHEQVRLYSPKFSTNPTKEV